MPATKATCKLPITPLLLHLCYAGRRSGSPCVPSATCFSSLIRPRSILVSSPLRFSTESPRLGLLLHAAQPNRLANGYPTLAFLFAAFLDTICLLHQTEYRFCIICSKCLLDGNLLQTKIHNIGATLVGVDKFGNKYYEKLHDTQYGRHRWVEYAEKGRYNASQVPPEWHGWLHHITDSTGDEASFLLCVGCVS
jgi:hypothetical protein